MKPRRIILFKRSVRNRIINASKLSVAIFSKTPLVRPYKSKTGTCYGCVTTPRTMPFKKFKIISRRLFLVRYMRGPFSVATVNIKVFYYHSKIEKTLVVLRQMTK